MCERDRERKKGRERDRERQKWSGDRRRYCCYLREKLWVGKRANMGVGKLRNKGIIVLGRGTKAWRQKVLQSWRGKL